jgi:hypothetical protein
MLLTQDTGIGMLYGTFKDIRYAVKSGYCHRYAIRDIQGHVLLNQDTVIGTGMLYGTFKGMCC